MSSQPGYDALAELYAETFPSPFTNTLQRHAFGAFVDHIRDSGVRGAVVDVGCGPGLLTAELAARGFEVVGVDPSSEMLRIARSKHPGLRFICVDATLDAPELGGVTVAALLARFSLIHVPPDSVPEILAGWSERMAAGSTVLVAGQTSADDEIVEFDHRVAPAWRWHTNRMSAALADAGFAEEWRTLHGADADHRFPEFHLFARRR
ncbi:class I SAM-dependent methyltransferase [Gordonia lacunae]|uniref:SAM-dependent methyltransferase n=1 Tax=Gordonia lacunae TaxID=417102 RepID=A0A243QFX1_9ACTN|nr:class I SAM-dependent methyltransferase [Gordonia lacunae]OUC79694.1 SAM-dependent methyltransferase [Gordonia lacunae]